ncbi:MAG: chorismate synthase [Pseudomonadota bacterium]|nr:chorismate synthase [Pseudomonadota bacterium]
MPSNFFGELFRITTWGESHGNAVGVTIDGIPAGLEISTAIIEEHLKWRRPGRKLTSPRKEQDIPEIVSGLFDGKSTGAPLSIIFKNTNAKKSQYQHLADKLRPGHANYSYLKKYGIYDYNGGGRASARETVCRVAAGAIAAQLLKPLGISVHTFLSEVGNISLPSNYWPSVNDLDNILTSPVFCPDNFTSQNIINLIEKKQAEGDSVGGTVKFLIKGAPAGLGEPIYQKLEAKLAYAMLSIPASKGFEIGSGFSASKQTGSSHNDLWQNDKTSQIKQNTNNCGGILGGISTGADIYGAVAFKPTSSIKKPQNTLDLNGKETILELPKDARHDPCVAIRATAVVKAMCFITLADAYLANKLAKAF